MARFGDPFPDLVRTTQLLREAGEVHLVHEEVGIEVQRAEIRTPAVVARVEVPARFGFGDEVEPQLVEPFGGVALVEEVRSEAFAAGDQKFVDQSVRCGASVAVQSGGRQALPHPESVLLLQSLVCVGEPLLVAGQPVDAVDHHGEVGRLRPRFVIGPAAVVDLAEAADHVEQVVGIAFGQFGMAVPDESLVGEEGVPIVHFAEHRPGRGNRVGVRQPDERGGVGGAVLDGRVPVVADELPHGRRVGVLRAAADESETCGG